MELSKVKLVTTKKGAKMAKLYYGVPESRIQVVQDDEVINLGKRNLRFIHAPWLHWPETMFTYLEEDRILFSCDFFGTHTASGFYDDDVDEILYYAQRYFGEIMMPFREMGRRAIEKLESLEIEIIAPSHGPIHRNPERIMKAYKEWTAGETKEKVVVVYASMWGSTEKMIKLIANTLLLEGVEVSLHDLASADIGEIAKDLVDSRAIVLGTPTVLGGMHPLALYATYLLRILRPPLKYAAVVSSYGWGGGAVKQLSEFIKGTKLEVVAVHEINGPPSNSDMEKVAEIAEKLVKVVRG
jgi:flavorubredoxin